MLGMVESRINPFMFPDQTKKELSLARKVLLKLKYL